MKRWICFLLAFIIMVQPMRNIDIVINQSLRGTGISDTARDMTDLERKIASLSASFDHFSRGFTQDFVGGLQKGSTSQEQFAQKLVATADKLGLSTREIRNMATATGMFTPTQLEAAAAEERVARKAEELATAFKAGKITTQQMGQQFATFAQQNQILAASAVKTTSAFSQLQAGIITANQAIGIAKQVYQVISGAIEATVGQYVKYVDEVTNVSRVTGMSLEETSRLIQASDDLFVSQETLTSGFEFAIRKGYQPSVEWLKTMSDQIMAIQDPAARARASIEIFGRQAGPEMVKMLEQGGAGIQQYIDAVDEGLIVTEESRQKTIEYKKAVDTLSDAWKSFSTLAGGVVIPAITDMLKMATADIQGFMKLPPLIAKAISAALRGDVHETALAVSELSSTAAGIINNNLPSFLDKSTEAQEELGLATEVTTGMLAMFGGNTIAATAYQQAYNEAKSECKLNEEAYQIALDAGNKALEAYTASVEKATQSVVAFGVSGQLGKIFAEADPDLQQATRSLTYYQGLLKQGPGVVEYYAQALDDVAEAYGTNSEEYEKAKKQYEAISTDYANAGGMVGSLTTKIDDLTTATERQISTLTYNQVASSLTAAGQLELARSFGLVDEASYTQAKTLMDLKLQYDINGDGVITAGEKQGEYLQQVQWTNEAIQYARDNNIPVTQDFVVNFRVEKQKAAEGVKAVTTAANAAALEHRAIYFNTEIDPTSEQNIGAELEGMKAPVDVAIVTGLDQASYDETIGFLDLIPTDKTMVVHVSYDDSGNPSEKTWHADIRKVNGVWTHWWNTGGHWSPGQWAVVGEGPSGWSPTAEVITPEGDVIPHEAAQKMKDTGMLDGAVRAADGGFWAGTHWVPVGGISPPPPGPSLPTLFYRNQYNTPAGTDPSSYSDYNAAVQGYYESHPGLGVMPGNPGESSSSSTSTPAIQSAIETSIQTAVEAAVGAATTQSQAAVTPVSVAAQQISASAVQTTQATLQSTRQATADSREQTDMLAQLLAEQKLTRSDINRLFSKLQMVAQSVSARTI